MTQQISIDEDALRFTFHSGIQAVKYDDWVHYRNQFQNKCCTDNKAVDIIAHNGQITWLCEVKDFRQGRRDPNKPPLEMEIAQKCVIHWLVWCLLNFTRMSKQNNNLQKMCFIANPFVWFCTLSNQRGKTTVSSTRFTRQTQKITQSHRPSCLGTE